ncbi:hypothetical protein N7492_005227 [Penicillium capsulatum]|uniref:Actin cortical patch SUR7/pH-response regulator PalI n=1 Tax=Penicillium capsulatum TaxID=69766 RepID=A0A9W9I903_9EURO|nr:hypothetical protein N7492_005227 [Penicillium capsulatum]KAJ6135668.1 hypothetical protein N7512_000828 [Penicillium capsulatum]
MADPKTFFPAVTAFIAFILTLICLFAGTQRNLLDSADLLTLYTPESPSGTTGTAHNFYSVHVMSYCQGTLGTVGPGAAGASRNVTSCSSRTILFSFDPTAAWPTEITQSKELNWPRVISDDFHAFRISSQSMAVLYCIGVGAMGAAVLVRASSFVAPRAQTGLFEFGFLVLGSLSISIASIIATVIALEFVALINAHGDGSNVSAKYGDKFLGMTWASAGLLLLGSIACFVNVFVRNNTPVAEAPPKDEEE